MAVEKHGREYVFNFPVKPIKAVPLVRPEQYEQYCMEDYVGLLGYDPGLKPSIWTDFNYSPYPTVIHSEKLGRDLPFLDGLPFGMYNVGYKNYNYTLTEVNPIDTGKMVTDFPWWKTIEREVTHFSSSKEVYEELGFPRRRSMLLYGPPGNGKTQAVLHHLQTVGANTYVFFLDLQNTDVMGFLQYVPQNIGNDAVFIFEELTYLEGSWRAATVLSFLDGYASMKDVMIIGTTNYPEKLPESLSNRPGRFDTLIPVGNPTEGERQLLLTHFGVEPTKELVSLTKGFSISYLREISLRSALFGMSHKEAAEELVETRKRARKDFATKGAMGFGEEK